MRLLRFICLLRGFHRAVLVINKYDSVEGVFGDTGPCETCGERLPQGSLPPEKAWNLLVWRA